MQKRYINYDILRVIACLMVLLMHSPKPGDNIIGVFTFGLTYMVLPCCPLFFALSGALLLPVNYHPNESLKYLKRRLMKIVIPTLCWTFIFLLFDEKFLSSDIVSISQTICSIPFMRQGHGILWFMYTLVGLYLLAPVISPWLKDAGEKVIRYYLCLWGLSLCYPWLSLFLRTDQSDTSWIYYFSGYAGYFILGYYLHNYEDKIRLSWTIIGFIIAIPIPVIMKLFFQDYIPDNAFWYLDINVALMTIFWWKIITHLCKTRNFNPQGKFVRFIALVSNLGFGIYLCHLLLMRYVVLNLGVVENMRNYILQTFVIFIMTCIFATICSYLISLLPIGSILIGYKKKKE